NPHGSTSCRGVHPAGGCSVALKCTSRHGRRASMREVGAPGVTRTPDSKFRKLLAVVEVLDISIAPSGLAGPRRAWTAAAASETGGRSAVREGLEGLQSLPCASCLGGWI